MELMIQYRVKSGLGDTQVNAVRDFVAGIKALDRPIRYRAYRMPDGVSFRHLVWIADNETKDHLQAQPFFQEFAQAMQARCEEGPAVTPLELVAATDAS